MENIPKVEEFISSVVNKYIVTSQNTNEGVNGYVFDIVLHEEVSLESEITDHYVEENYAIQDHIAKRPAVFVLKGIVGELVNKPSVNGSSVLENVQSLGDIAGLAPNLSSQASQVYSKIESVVSTVNSYINQANNIIDIFYDKTSADTKQGEAFDFFSNLWNSRTLCTVETPYGIFKDIAIHRISAIQRDETNIVSDFQIMFKQIRTVKSIQTTKKSSGRFADSISNFTDKGRIVGKTVEYSSFSLSGAVQ